MQSSGYAQLSKHDADNGDQPLNETVRLSIERRPSKIFCCATILVILIVASAAAALAAASKVWSESKASSCKNPRIRREWRSLFSEEKEEYIRAVKCLETIPSTVGGRGSLYDDFVYIHMVVGRKCTIPYWSWDMDWYDLQDSSIFDPVQGFGGDGDPNGPESPGDGHCLNSGPFKGSQRIYYDDHVEPHCLGRGFRRKDTAAGGALQGEWFSPEAIGQLKRSANYDSLRNTIEDDFHNGLHWTIGGDFEAWTAGNDPIFFLHHGQLDRLWWIWQSEDPAVRLTDYSGVSFNTTVGRANPASLKDQLNYMDLWDNITVSQVMNTEHDILCYRYS